jgi:hypothetical protein
MLPYIGVSFTGVRCHLELDRCYPILTSYWNDVVGQSCLVCVVIRDYNLDMELKIALYQFL